MKDIDRDRIRAEIKELEEDQRISGHCGRHVLRIMNLQNQLDWDDYLKNGLSAEDKKVFESIVSGEGEGIERQDIKVSTAYIPEDCADKVVEDLKNFKARSNQWKK